MSSCQIGNITEKLGVMNFRTAETVVKVCGKGHLCRDEGLLLLHQSCIKRLCMTRLHQHTL